MAKEKVLIIKLGLSETLVGEISRKTSLGDVLRSTVLLPLFKDARVTWLVEEKAYALLKGNKLITRILPYDLTTVLQLKGERFDTIINLEKVAGICALSDSLNAWRRFGFRFDPDASTAKAYAGSQHAPEICTSPKDKIAHPEYWEEVLFSMVGEKWQGEIPTLGYKPRSKVKFDIGFNHNVGDKWPLKAWPAEYWKELEAIIGDKYTITWQEGLGSLDQYIEWINSVQVLVTNDSLGLHIAHALGKKIVALFGPTKSGEIYIKDGEKLLPRGEYKCMPCLSTKCVQKKACMYEITPKMVYSSMKKLL